MSIYTKKQQQFLSSAGDWEPFQESGRNQHLQTMVQFPAL